MTGTLANEVVGWRFNPAGAPHFGGAMQSLVKSAKRALFNVLGKNTLREKKLSTIVCLTEQLLNNRPLLPLNADIDDLDSITPSLFLIGGPNNSWSQSLMSDQNVSYRRMFRTVNEQLEHIRKSWLKISTNVATAQEMVFEWSIIKKVDLVWVLNQSVLFPLSSGESASSTSRI